MGAYCSNSRYHARLRALAPPAGPKCIRHARSPGRPLPHAHMRLSARALLLLAASLTATPALAQQPGQPRIDPCTGKPYTPPAPSSGRAGAAQPAAPAPSADGATPAAPGSAATPSANGGPHPAASTSSPSAARPAGTPVPGGEPRADGAAAAVPGGGVPASANGGSHPTAYASPASAPAPQGAGPCASAPAADPARATRVRESLRLGRGAVRGEVRLGPAASVSVPTAFGVDAGEVFLGVAYQGRTRYTEDDDAAGVAGLGIGTRRVLALEVALTSYSTLRGAPLETGGVSFKLHRVLPGNTSVAVGWENAVLWGGSDDDGSLYAAATRVVPLRADPGDRFSVGVVTVGIGNGRFRFEQDDADGNETVNVFAAAGLRVSAPLSVMADWTGQDLNLAASITPLRRAPFVVTAGVADLTGNAGDGARFILSLGYGLSIRQPF